jgi:hypothetical protein
MDTPPQISIPRALPHRSAEDIVAEAAHSRRELHQEIATLTARLQRRTLWLVGTAALASLLAVALVVLGVSWPQANSALFASAPTGEATQPATPIAVKSKDASSKQALAGGSTPPAAPTVSEPGPTQPVPKLPADRPNGAQKEVFLEILGGLSAAHLYQSYLTVGLLADGVENKTYTIEEARKTLKTVTTCMSLVEDKLAKLPDLQLDAQDRESLERLKTATALLRVQSRILDACWAAGRTQPPEQYQQSRKASWTALSKLLGLEAP